MLHDANPLYCIVSTITANEIFQLSGEMKMVKQPIGSVVIQDKHAKFQLVIHLSQSSLQRAYPVFRSWRRNFERRDLSKPHPKALANIPQLIYQLFSDLSGLLHIENGVMWHIDGCSKATVSQRTTEVGRVFSVVYFFGEENIGRIQPLACKTLLINLGPP